MTDENIEDFLHNLDVSDYENDGNDDDEEEAIFNSALGSQRQIGLGAFDNVDWSDNTDSNPDYVPEYESDEDETVPSTSKKNTGNNTGSKLDTFRKKLHELL